jgi:hypoxia up-regulated 1
MCLLVRLHALLPRMGLELALRSPDKCFAPPPHVVPQVSLVKPGQSFQIAINLQSKRKTPALLAYYAGDRVFGSDAESLAARKPRVVVADPQKLLGRNSTHPASVQYAGPSYYGTTQVTNSRGGLDFLLPSDETGTVPALEMPVAEGEGESEKKGIFSSLFGSSKEAEASAFAVPEGSVGFSSEELSAQLLEHVREFTEDFAGGAKIRDTVITVPAYYTQHERLSLLDAAELAGLHVLALLDENTAAGIHYGIDRVADPGTTHWMVLYNMGAESTQVTLFAYDSYMLPEKGGILATPPKDAKPKSVGQGRVVAKAWDVSLGGRAFDAALINLVADTFNAGKQAAGMPASAKGDIRNVPLSMAKVRKNVGKAKEVLSANEEFGLTVESILPDVDFRMQLSRSILEKTAATAGLWDRVTGVLDACLAQTGGAVSLHNVSVVEVVGGGVRMPRVQSLLKEHVAKFAPPAGTVNSTGPSVGVHLNGDEAMALGAAFAAANRSAAFRVRKVGMIDAFPFPIGVRVSHMNAAAAMAAATAAATEGAVEIDGFVAEGEDAAATPATTGKAGKLWSKRSALFRPYNALDSVKRISFTADKDLRALLYYETVTGATSPSLPEGTARVLGVYNISGIETLMMDPKNAALGPPKIHISFELDINGVARVLKAEATQEEEVMVPIPEEPKAKATPSVNATVVNGTNSTATEGEESATASPSAEASASASPEASAEGAAAAEGDAAVTPAAPKMKAVKRTHKHALTLALDLSATGLPVRTMNAVEKGAATARLRKLKAVDEAKRAVEGAKNALEGFIYATRERMEQAASADEDAESAEAGWSKVTNETGRESMSAAMAAQEEWLLEDGVADLEGYRTRLRELKAVIDPPFFRLAEKRTRVETVERGRSAVSAAKEIIIGWETSHPQVRAPATYPPPPPLYLRLSWARGRTLALPRPARISQAPAH